MAKGLETAMCPIASLVPRLSGLVPRTLPLRRIARNYRVKMNSTSDINSYHMRQLVKSWKPDLLISIYINQRLAKDLLNVAPMGAINVHPSLLPQHRGLFPYIWAMAGGDRETGVTVHWMDETLDTGAIIQQRSTPIHQGESAISLAHRCADLGGKMLVDAIDRVRRGVASHIRQEPGQGSYHSWPDRDCLRRCKQHGHPYLSLVDMWRELSRAA